MKTKIIIAIVIFVVAVLGIITYITTDREKFPFEENKNMPNKNQFDEDKNFQERNMTMEKRNMSAENLTYKQR